MAGRIARWGTALGLGVLWWWSVLRLALVPGAGMLEGGKGIKELLRRLVAWRVSWMAYLAVCAGPMVLALLPIQLNALMGGEAPPGSGWGSFLLFSRPWRRW